MIPVKDAESTHNLPAGALLADGRSPYEKPGAQLWTSDGVVNAELRLREAAVARGAATMSQEEAAAYVARFAEAGVELGRDQAAAVMGVLTSGAWLEVLCAAAGTGKSFTVGAVGEAWREHGHNVFGLATSQKATDVLTEEGLEARNIAQWLAAQDRLSAGQTLECDTGLTMRAGDLVVVDEASMTSSLDLAKVQERCEAAGAKLLLVGDPHQLAAVGPGGALADAAEHGVRYDLTEVRRFAEDWEKHASLAFRAGDKAAVAEYQKHGRLVDSGTVEQAEQAAAEAWLADTLAGREALLVAGSNEQAARLSGQLRAELVALKQVAEHGVRLGLDGNTAGVGDVVQARHNGWDHRGWEGNGTGAPVNRKTYEVLGVREDGGLTVALRVAGELSDNRLELKPGYVAEHLALGYASTAHAAQGRTVDRGHLLFGRSVDAEAALVGMTRGRERNTAWGVTREIRDEQDPRDVHAVKPTTTAGALAAMLEDKELTQSAWAEREQADVDARSTKTHADRLIDQVGALTAGRVSLLLDELAMDGRLAETDRERLAAEGRMWSLEAVVRRAELAGHDPRTVLAEAVDRGGFDDAKSVTSVLHSRVAKSLGDGPRVSSHADLIPAGVPDAWRPWLEDRARDADNRRLELGAQMAEQAPGWAVSALGPVPDDPLERLEWEDRAGRAAAYREMTGVSSDDDALGSAPPGGMPDKYALWAAAHEALGLPDAADDDRGVSDRLLQLRVHAWEREKNWLPAHVGHELAAVELARQRAKQHATLADARAEVTEDAVRAAELRAEAAEAAAAAERLAGQAAQLQEADERRAQAFMHTAPTRAAAERARVVLGQRGVDVDEVDQQTTAMEWTEAHLAEQAEDEVTRPVRDEAELVDGEAEELWAAAAEGEPDVVAETNVPDIRELAEPWATEDADADDRWRVPSESETEAAVGRARDALLEMRAREELDRRSAEDERLQELAEWHAAEQAREAAVAEQQAAYEFETAS